MTFTLLSYAANRIEIGSERGHKFAFQVVRNADSRVIVISDARWSGGQPGEERQIIEFAQRFATVCAVDCGLI